MPRLYIENLDVNYGEHKVVKDFSIDIPDQKITTIIGPNGCGKSTLLKAITRIISHQSGQVILDGDNIARKPTKTLASQMAILPQQSESAAGLTVGELVSYGRYPYQKGFGRLSKADKAMIEWSLEMTGTQSFKYDAVDTLSGGQRQRVWIAMALAQETDMIFLDEPTTYLDLAHQLEVLELLQQLNIEEQRTIVMVQHDINQAARFSDHLIALQDGQIIKSGSCDDVVTADVLRSVFSIDAAIGRDPRTHKPMCLTYNLIKGDQQREHKKAITSIPTLASAQS